MKVLHVTDGKDPDEYVKKNGRDAFLELVGNALSYGEYKLESAKLGYDLSSDEGRLDYMKKAVEIIAAMSPLEQEIYKKKMAGDLGVAESAIDRELALRDGRRSPQTSETRRQMRREENAPEAREEISPLEKTLLKLVLTDDDYLPRLAEEKDLWIISDEIYERLVYGVPHTSIASLPGMAERTIVLNGFSKAFSMTGWRIGYAAADAGLIKKMNTVHQINTTSAVSFVQKAAIAALSQENEEVESMRKEYHRRRDYVYQEVNRIQGLHAGLPEGAFYLFINIKELGVPAGEFARILLEEQLTAVVPGTVFGRNGEGHIRLSFAASEEELKEGVSRRKKAAELLHKR